MQSWERFPAEGGQCGCAESNGLIGWNLKKKTHTRTHFHPSEAETSGANVGVRLLVVVLRDVQRATNESFSLELNDWDHGAPAGGFGGGVT